MSECSQRPCKQRFKGVENFLRRVAFNLGNTASQTEVKIISCIPIDVTDLQQKIINLERQLFEAQEQICKRKSSKLDKIVNNSRSTLVHTAFYNSGFAKESSNLSYCRKSQDDINLHHVAIDCDNCSSKGKRSAVAFSPATTRETFKASKLDSCASSNNVGHKANLVMERYKNIFRTRIKKKNKGKANLKTHLVYYAQTPNNGFNINPNRRIIDSVEALCRSHLDNIVKKQYDPNVMIEQFSDTSQFTTPICRDTDEGKHCFDCNSEVCSCCYGTFQNIDNYMSSRGNYNDYRQTTNEAVESNLYRNSNDYDLIPVKENPLRNLTKKETKIDIDIECWPELLQAKQRHHPLIVNYQTEFIPKTRQIPKHTQKHKAKLQTKEINNKYKTNQLNVHTNLDFPSKRGFVECSDVYKKHRRPKNYLQKSEPAKVIVLKNEVTSTNDIEQHNIQRITSQLNTVDDTKTESTLDQIKVMLQNVLTEMKTSGKLNNSADETIKKDAVVQKSMSNIQGASTLLNSFTYNNSYNVNPYAPSYSRQAPYCVTNMPYQHMKVENFPVFIHSSPRKHMRVCYCKNNVYKQTNTATNTEKYKQEPAKNETEMLIKEIYNSMALNLDLTTKENSLSECGDVKSTDGSTNTPLKVNSRRSMNANKRDIEIEAILTSLDSYSEYSLTTHTAATQSDNRSRTTEMLYHMNNKHFGNTKYVDGARNFIYNREGHRKAIVEGDETEESSDERDSVETVVTNRREENKTEKKGLLQRMLKSVKLFRTKKHESQNRFDNADAESDSDDYETIYSKQSTPPPLPKQGKYPRNNMKNNNLAETERKEPYLEQEYRRRWNENLTFHDQTNFPNYNTQFPKNYKRTPFWTNYEARNVTVETPHNIVNPRPPSYKTHPKASEKRKDKLKWPKKHKLGLKCGEQWKRFVLEN